MRSDRLREIREIRGLSQQELAIQCGLGVNAIWRYENGETDPSADVLGKLAKELEVSTDYLVGLVADPTGQLREQDLSPMERRLIDAVRKGLIVETLETLAVLSKNGEEPVITPGKPALSKRLQPGSVIRYNRPAHRYIRPMIRKSVPLDSPDVSRAKEEQEKRIERVKRIKRSK